MFGKRQVNIEGESEGENHDAPADDKNLDTQLVDEKLLYVGKAKNLKKRILSYGNLTRHNGRLLRMLSELEKITITITDTETEALLLESNLIKKLNPYYNILLKDDKSMPRLLIKRDHDFPRMVKHRGAQNEKGDYFGPFPSSSSVNHALIHLQKIFQLRDCTDNVFKAHHARPCMRYQIKRCSAPCAKYISKQDYEKSVSDLKAFLSGKHDEVRGKIKQEMQEFSAATEYEKAAHKRNQLEQLARITAFQKINIDGIKDADIIALTHEYGQSCIAIFFYRNGCLFGHRNYFPKHFQDAARAEIMNSFLGQFYSAHLPPPTLLLNIMPDDIEFLASALGARRGGKIDIQIPKQGKRKKVVMNALNNARQALQLKHAKTTSWKKSLALLQEKLTLPKAIHRIEIYDNSHLQGTNAVSAMVVADEEGLARPAYRKFNIRTPQKETGGDDYAMMYEVMNRRFTRYLKQEKNWAIHPDLLLIDGGKGQVGIVKSVLDGMGISDIAILGIAKGQNRNAFDENFITDKGAEFKFDKNDPLLFFLQNLRDEAHRYAIGAHRQKRKTQNFQNPLDEIQGIGKDRKRKLLEHFGSAKSVANAALEDLQNIQGISTAMAAKIYQHFHD